MSPDRLPASEFPISDVSSLGRFVGAFERARLPRSRWTHSVRLALAVWYLWERPEWDAAERYLNLLRRYSRGAVLYRDHYHETVALFWFIVARRFVERHRQGDDLLATINSFVSDFGDRQDLCRSYYSRALLASSRARQSWVEPDRRSLDDLGCVI